ncbi:hypothetical protein ACFWDG_23950, partial [Peribacillus sp. NPDC060186]
MKFGIPHYSFEDVTGVPVTHMMPNLGTGELSENQSLLISERDYNKVTAFRKLDPVQLSGEEALFIYPYATLDFQFVQKGDKKKLHYGKKIIQVTMLGQRNQTVITPIGSATTLMVVDDKMYT